MSSDTDELRRQGPAPLEGLRVVLLDGLGTLVALAPPWPALVRALRTPHGLRLEPAAAERAFRAEMAYYRAHHHEGRDEQTLADLRWRCAEVLRGELPRAVGEALGVAEVHDAMLGALRFEAYPDAPGALRALRARGLELVVVSNWDVSLSKVLTEVGLAELLDGVVTSASVGERKPGRAIFAAALERCGVAAQQAVHVGDSLVQDVAGARAAGIRAVLLCRVGTEPARVPSGVRVIASLNELLT
jgi:putative hydrolase of the HAD superfamily